jgi:hypothetical protein
MTKPPRHLTERLHDHIKRVLNEAPELRYKPPLHGSTKYIGKRPFKKGDKTPYGIYIGKHRGCFVFGSGQKDGNGLELANHVSEAEESIIEYLLSNKK